MAAQHEALDADHAELLSLRAIKIDQDAQITFLNGKLKGVVAENDKRKSIVSDLERKLVAANSTIEKRNLEVKEKQHQIQKAILAQKSETSQIKGLTLEKHHLEQSLAENTQLKEQYRCKSDVLETKYEELSKEVEGYKRQIVGIEELRRDRDERIESLRRNIEALESANLKIEKNFGIQTVKFEHS